MYRYTVRTISTHSALTAGHFLGISAQCLLCVCVCVCGRDKRGMVACLGMPTCPTYPGVSSSIKYTGSIASMHLDRFHKYYANNCYFLISLKDSFRIDFYAHAQIGILLLACGLKEQDKIG